MEKLTKEALDALGDNPKALEAFSDILKCMSRISKRTKDYKFSKEDYLLFKNHDLTKDKETKS